MNNSDFISEVIIEMKNFDTRFNYRDIKIGVERSCADCIYSDVSFSELICIRKCNIVSNLKICDEFLII